MNKITGIYKITSPKGKVYIGQSVNINNRFLEYKRMRCKKQRKLYNSLLKYGYENHTFEIINQCSEKELNNLELYYEELFNSCGKNGLNIRKAGGSRGRHTNESIELMKISQSNRTQEHINNHLSSIKGNKFSLGKVPYNKGKVGLFKHSKESKEKISKARIGKKVSAETRKNMSIAQKTHIKSPEHIKKCKENLLKISPEGYAKRAEISKKIILDYETGVFYIGVEDAAKAFDVNKNTLTKKLNGTAKNNTKLMYV